MALMPRSNRSLTMSVIGGKADIARQVYRAGFIVTSFGNSLEPLLPPNTIK
jgi:hypothetical protein